MRDFENVSAFYTRASFLATYEPSFILVCKFAAIVAFQYEWGTEGVASSYNFPIP